ncbi:MAG: RDD family protein [Proteobacteria bacterium]|nr:RDD family protein [Pseudomonadota bacterium]
MNPQTSQSSAHKAWFISVNGQNLGPFTEEDMRAKLKTGEITSTTFIWCEGMANWIPLGQSPFGASMPPQMFNYQSPTTYATPAEVDCYGGFWIRVLAYIIDGCLLAIPHAVFKNQGDIWGWLIFFLYKGVLESALEGSPGKLVLGLRLVREDYYPTQISQTLLRAPVLMLSGLCFGIGLFVIGGDRRKQGWHDRVAKTVVVKKEFLEKVGGQRK